MTDSEDEFEDDFCPSEHLSERKSYKWIPRVETLG
jgi:hypothetical protein